VATAPFALETCYYGLGLRSRPGTLIVTDTELIHFSYSWRDTLWAILEPSVCVAVPLASVREVLRLPVDIKLSFLQLFPNSVFRVVTHDGIAHDLVLQRNSEGFIKALSSNGLVKTVQ
jgi:hypothetical protein